MTLATDFFDVVFGLDAAIRYVAVAQGQRVEMSERSGLTERSASESGRYEELLVNPALMTLASHRGDIDCGGFGYLIVRYGFFFQIVMPLETGHISVAVQPEGDPIKVASKLADMLHNTASLPFGTFRRRPKVG